MLLLTGVHELLPPMTTAFFTTAPLSSFHARHSLSYLCTSTSTSIQSIRTPKNPISISATSVDKPQIEELDSDSEEQQAFEYDIGQATNDLKNFDTYSLEITELEELPEQWRRSKLAWLCKELPSHKIGTVLRLLNAQRKWITQENTTYIAVHFIRIRENETAFKVYKWMMKQHWYHFDFEFVTRLANYMGKERKYLKCREVFDDIIKQGRVPSESTFHILIVAYLSSKVEGCVDEACGIYNRMIQFGGYEPRLSLQNSLFKALVSKPGKVSKHYLKQAEFIFHNMVTSRFEVTRDIYAGLLWLHSYQDEVDTERIVALREEMKGVGIEEGRDVLVSVMRAYSKQGDVEEVERTWVKLLETDKSPPSQAFVYRMEVYAKVGEPRKALAVFEEMKGTRSTNVVSYHRVIQVMSKAQEVEIAESLVKEFIKTGMQPLIPSYIDLMNMYLDLNMHAKVEATFLESLEKCNPNRTIFTIYLDSLLKVDNIDEAAEIFNQMYSNAAVGVNSRSCNIILSGYLSREQYNEAEKIYDLMCLKKYDVDPALMDKLEFVLNLNNKVVKKQTAMKLSMEQREILIGLLLGGLRIESDEERKNHALHFEFNENSSVHSVLRRHIHDQFHEWLNSFSRPSDENDTIPNRFSTISHTCFGFYADQFFPKGRVVMPKLVHRWLAPCVLAYWYMYGGCRTPSGDILLKLKGGTREDVEKIVMALKAKSLDCKVKRKGRVFWIGFFGSNSVWFWKLTEPYILDEIKDLLRPDVESVENEESENQINSFESASDSDERELDSDLSEDNENQ